MSDASATTIESALRKRDLPGALALAESALAKGEVSALALRLAAYRLELDAKYDQALGLLDQALQLTPGDPAILNSIGVCHSKASRPLEAFQAFSYAIKLAPGYALAHHGIGLALAALGDAPAALAAQTEAARLDPNYPDPLGALAAIAAESGDAALARGYAERALALDPQNSAATLALAKIEVAEGDFETAQGRLRPLLAGGQLSPLHEASARLLLADALDATDRPREAIADYLAGKAEFRRIQIVDMARAGAELGVEMCARLARYFEAAEPATWKPASAPAPSGASGHVFLIGFPRSGTTLLEQVLASHPDIVALEEKDTLESVFGEFFSSNDALDRLATLSADEEEQLRAAYWSKVRGFGVDVDGKVFVDKQPFYTLLLPAIAKLFPDAKIIIARRDPRDVVVSCFRNRFHANPLLVEFTDLERSALLYDGVMRLAEIFEPLFALPTHVQVHERLVENFEAETAALCAFLGVEPDSRMAEFAETARQRDVRTPSAPQVRRGLNSEGVGRWRRYGDAITPILPILAPWVAKFGYPEA